MEMIEAVKCQCGAVTVEAELEGGSVQSYSMTEETLNETIGNEAIAPVLREEVYVSCNHCVNNWGVDLCACGSGEKPDECDNELEMCGTPMQTLDLPHRTSFWR